MALDQADLCKKAAKLESLELKEIKFSPLFMSELEAFLLDIYAGLRPLASEYEQRMRLIHAFDTSVKSTFGNNGGFPVVEAFGSFVMDIFSAKSDLDLSINFGNSIATCFPRDEAVKILRMFSKDLFKGQRKGLLSGVTPILRARVPVLKAVDCMSGIECDISVENQDGISRSLFFSIISSIDERFRILSYLTKAWANANGINSSKDRTLNSLSIITLVAFHFQTRDPPILPPFWTLLKDGGDIRNLRKVVVEFINFGRKNKETVAHLFVTLLSKLLSVEKLWEQGLCASTFEGSWISKTSDSNIGIMSVEDFLDRSQNIARSVGKLEMPNIYNCIRRSLEHLSSTMRGQFALPDLRSALFGSISSDPQRNRFNVASTQKRKFRPDPANKMESPQPRIDNKRAQYAMGIRASGFGYHENQQAFYHHTPITHPTMPYVQPHYGPLDRNIPFYGDTGHGSDHRMHPPFTNHMIYALQLDQAVHPERNFAPNTVVPGMFPG